MARKARLSKTTANTMRLRAPVTVTASAEPGEGERQGPPKFSSLAYSGGLVPGYTASPPLPHPYVIDLAETTSARSPKVNLAHKQEQRVGQITTVENDGKTLNISGTLSAATTYRDEVVNSALDGYEWEMSIEANLGKKRLVAAGKTATVNGQSQTGPFFIFSKNQFTGSGFVNNGADEGNSVKVAASAAGETQMNEFDLYIVSCGADPEAITDAHRAVLQKSFNALKGGATTGDEPLSFTAAAESVRKENQRKETIQTMALGAMKTYPMHHEQIQLLATAALSSDTAPKDFELELLRGTRIQAGAFSASSGASHARTNPEMIECALSMQSGLPNIEKHYSEQTLNAVDRAGMKNMGLQEFVMQTAQANGYTCRAGERIHVGNIRTVLQYAFPPATANLGGFSTVVAPNILGSVANKQIISGYMEEDQSWKEVAEIRPVSNFYAQNYYRMLDSLEYEEVGSGGEIKHGTLGEETYQSQAKTYGKMLGITRTQLINDDLGAFNDIRTRLGRGAAKKFGNVFWAAFMNNATFFTAALTNYISGSTTNLGTDGVGLGLIVTAFRQMTSPAADGYKRVGAGLNPTKIIVPPELENNGDLAYKNGNLGMVKSGDANIFQGKYRPVVQWRLSNSSFTGNSTTAFYVGGDEVKPMLVTFLNGNQTPIVETAEADFNTLGIQFRGYHDFGCDKSEYLSYVKSKGAA